MTGRPETNTICSAESQAAAAPAGINATSVAFLAGHMLRDGELVVLILRPSRWFILLSGLKFLTAVAIVTALVAMYGERIRYPATRAIETGVLVMAARLMWGILQWMGRLYILTDMRILRFAGVFNVDIFDCPLRKVARTHLEATVRERLLMLGSIAIIPQDEKYPIGVWQMVSKPVMVHEKIRAMIARAKQGCP